MRSIFAAALTGALLMAGNSASGASFDSGNDLYNFCSKTDAFSDGMCLGLISGYFDNLHLAYTCQDGDGQITRRQIRDMVVNDLRDKPETRHQPAFILATTTFVRAFKCESWVADRPQK